MQLRCAAPVLSTSSLYVSLSGSAIRSYVVRGVEINRNHTPYQVVRVNRPVDDLRCKQKIATARLIGRAELEPTNPLAPV
jgi:hypothetical protein